MYIIGALSLEGTDGRKNVPMEKRLYCKQVKSTVWRALEPRVLSAVSIIFPKRFFSKTQSKRIHRINVTAACIHCVFIIIYYEY